MTQDPTVPGWYDKVIDFIARKNRTAALRRELAEARRLGKERRHRERLRKRVPK